MTEEAKIEQVHNEVQNKVESIYEPSTGKNDVIDNTNEYVKFDHICKKYDNGFEAVKDFNLSIAQHEFIVFVGPSGCGKSTTLRMVAGLEMITSGNLYIDGVLVNDLSPKDRNIAMVFQNYALYPHMTVYDNMAYALKIRKLPKKEINERVHEAAKILEIEDLLDRKPKALSGGQRQRVALGRAIVRNAKVFLMDEPLSNLDAKLRVQMRSEIIRLHNRLNATTIYVTHDQTEAMTMASRIVIMKAGVVQQIGSPIEIYNEPVNKFVAGFIGSPSMNFFNVKYEKNSLIFNNGTTIKLPKDIIGDMKLPSNVIVGIRPDDIHGGDGTHAKEYPDAVFEVEVNVAELLGSNYYIHSTFDGKDLVFCQEAKRLYHIGDKIKIVFNLKKIKFFDPGTEMAL